MKKTLVKWIVDLPLRIQCQRFIKVDDDLVESPLTVTKFTINGFKMELLRKESNTGNQNKVFAYEELSIEAEIEYDEDNDLIIKYPDEKKFNKAYIKKYKEAAVAAQSFLDGISKATANMYYQIMDENSFVLPHKEFINGSIVERRGHKEKDSRGIDDNLLQKAVDFANRDKRTLDNAWYLLRNAERFMWDGLYDLSILNMAIMLEMLVKARLAEYLCETNGKFKSEIIKGIKYLNYKSEFKKYYNNKECHNMPFVNEYFDFGLFTLKEDPKFDADDEKHKKLMNTIHYIYKIRNSIAHGKSLYNVKLLKENELSRDNFGDVLHEWIIECDEIYYYFCGLENI